MSKITIKDEADFVKIMIDRDLSAMHNDNHKLTYLKVIGDYIDDTGDDIIQANKNAKATLRELVSEEDITPNFFADDKGKTVSIDTPITSARLFNTDLIDSDSHYILNDVDQAQMMEVINEMNAEELVDTVAFLTGESNTLNNNELEEKWNHLFNLACPPDLIGAMNPIEFMKTNNCLQGAEAHDYLTDHKFSHTYDHIHVFTGDRVMLMPTKISGLEYVDYVSWIKLDGVYREGPLTKILHLMFEDYIAEYRKHYDNITTHSR